MRISERNAGSTTTSAVVTVVCGALSWLMFAPQLWWIGFGCVVVAIALGSHLVRSQHPKSGWCIGGILLAVAACAVSFVHLRGT